MTTAEYALSCVGKSRYDLGLNKSGEWCAELYLIASKKLLILPDP